MQFRHALCFALWAVASAAEVTPIEKVINLIDDMKQKVEADGAAEAKAYGDFACFCKDTTATKSTSVKDGNDRIDALSADIADKTAQKEEAVTETAERKDEHVKMNMKLSEEEVAWKQALSAYQVKAADLSKAIFGLSSAIKSMKDSKPAPAALLSIRKGLSHTLELAEAMDMIAAPKHKKAASFLQGQASVDPKDPEYEYHSNDIVSLLEKLHGEFTEEKRTVDAEHGKQKAASEELRASLRKKLSANSAAMQLLVQKTQRLSKQIAEDREALVNSQGDLKDDEHYLKDLTARCEARANDWDQRSAMRNDEITALSTALKVLKDEVTPADAANQRAMFIQKWQAAHATEQKAAPVSSPKLQSISLLQEQLTQTSAVHMRGSMILEDKKKRALDVLKSEGDRINSLVLTSLAAQSAADPFKKVKGLIQKLIERLLAESAAEATKKGFCDTELGKARKERDFRRTESKDLNNDLEALEAKRDELTEEIKRLNKELGEERTALKEATAERKEEKGTNAETLKTAKEGHEAVTEALQVLRVFYKQAAKAVFLQASPVDEDTQGPGFSGSYGGSQSGSKAVLALLETIQSDFDRTIRTTEKAEAQSHSDFTDFDRESQSSIAGKETKVELDGQDLETTKTNIKVKFGDLQTAQNLLDASLKELEDLKPTCIDTGMSYAERVEKREQEMEALRKALCILDGEGVEPECK
jgi:uncharacterized coiled-coil DUF342 family protein